MMVDIVTGKFHFSISIKSHPAPSMGVLPRGNKKRLHKYNKSRGSLRCSMTFRILLKLVITTTKIAVFAIKACQVLSQFEVTVILYPEWQKNNNNLWSLKI